MPQTVRIVSMIFACCVFGVINADSSLSKLVARINELEKRDQQMIQVIQNQGLKIQALQNDNDKLHDQLTTIDDRNTHQKEMIESLQSEVKQLKNAAKPTNHINKSALVGDFDHDASRNSLSHKIESFDIKARRQNDKLTRKFLLNGAETVAFHATLDGDVHVQHIAVGTPITFPNVKFNMGGGYHPSTSLFIAPLSGIYMFSASIMSSLRDTHPVHAGIMKNGTYLAGVYAGKSSATGGPEQGSVTLTTHLNVGDEVWVQHHVHDDGEIYAGGLTSFTGCLIMPL